MIENKYLLMIGVIICDLILYYFYDEISNVKKTIIPSYQKTMALEAKIIELEKKTNELATRVKVPSKKCARKQIESPVMSITYQSDMINKNNNLSARYTDIPESEVIEIRKKIEKITKKTGSPKSKISDSDPVAKKDNINIFDITSHQLDRSPNCESYIKILEGLSADAINAGSDDQFDIISSAEFDLDVARCISDSVNFADLDQNNMSELSDIPVGRSDHMSEVSDICVKQKLQKVNKTLAQIKPKKSGSKQ